MVVILAAAIFMLAIAVWNAIAWPAIQQQGAASGSTLSILIPARNEEENLPECLEAAMRQSPSVCEILVYDDHSTDRTSAVVADFARRDPRVRVLPPVDLPEGWHGKAFACSRLAEAARGEWMLFLDADARLTGDVAASIVAEAEARAVTLLSPWPGLELVGAAERLLMPLLNVVVFTLFPAPLSLRYRLPSLGLAHGACILVRRQEYEMVGGHALVRGEIFEDTALARAWRASGMAGICLDGRRVVRVRMYRSFSGIWRGFQKNFYLAFRRPASFWLFLFLHFAVFVLPAPLALASLGRGAGDPSPWLALAAGWAIRLTQAARFGYPAWSALAHPFSEAVLIALGVSSWYRVRLGGGVEWKGRRYRG